MEEKTMKFYCTKWVLTRGIIEFDGEQTMHGYVSENSRSAGRIFGKIGKEVFANLDEADINALQRAKKNVTNCKKRLEKSKKQLAEFEAGNIPVRGRHERN